MKNALEEKPKKVFINMNRMIIEFGFKTREEIKNFMNAHHNDQVYLDLSCYDPADFYFEYPQLKGSFAALFADESKKIEIHFRQKDEAVLSELKSLGFTPIETTITSCGFIFPRTIAQIVNEAFYALEDGIASDEDIDRAMKFGVNYPKGPFEWAQGKEKFFIQLLHELKAKTGDDRYKVAPKLLEKLTV
jgi:hypothetical protein